MQCLGRKRSQALVRFHTFSGEDHGNEFVGISKKSWCKLFFDLPADSPIIDTFIHLGSLTVDHCSLLDGGLNEAIKPLEMFTCMAYDAAGPHNIPDLRWKLWSKKNKEAENLPPSRATLCPLIQRTDYVSRIYKSYNTAHPELPAVTESGWVHGGHDTNIHFPVYCLLPPAPIAVLELVKCGCNGVCNKKHCSCFKGSVPCTSLCQCSDDCLNVR